ncbi:MAG: Rpn family recombination-promoting nuclease/putative transposase [Prevotella sp.]|nr:Rpn family recombination-promoting nuclease/putative transposase [Prevotella sp.]MDY3968497.1 Rpn family recombination-promoting nuclease/putative transposase [Prevotella sp.]
MRQSEERYIRISDKNSNKKIFTKLFDAAAIARFSPTELREYEDSLKAYRDIKNSLDTAKEEGRAEGREEGRAEGREEGRAEGREEGRAEGIAMVAKMMYAKGMDIDVIASMTGLSTDEVESLCRQ